MKNYEDELLNAAQHLLSRKAARKGPIPSARIRRSVSTAYYAMFHFIAEEAAGRCLGKAPRFQARRRTLARIVTHAGIRAAFMKMRGDFVDRSVVDLFGAQTSVAISVPEFVQIYADVFVSAQSKREEADYDLTTAFCTCGR